MTLGCTHRTRRTSSSGNAHISFWLHLQLLDMVIWPVRLHWDDCLCVLLLRVGLVSKSVPLSICPVTPRPMLIYLVSFRPGSHADGAAACEMLDVAYVMVFVKFYLGLRTI